MNFVTRRTGFAIPMAVVMLVMLAIGIFSMMLFSGSQTRSMRNDIDAWQARELAISAIKVAGEKLREGRWYGKASVVGSMSSNVTGGGYVFVCEDTKRVIDFMNETANASDRVGYKGQEYSKIAVLDHIDVFARGFYGKQSVVAYGRFIVGPEAEFLSTSTDGLIRTADGKNLVSSPFTLKRMVAVTVFKDRSLYDISVREVRNKIRDRVTEQTQKFITNYGRVKWDAAAPTTISTAIDTNSAKGILASYWGGSVPNLENVFLRDRFRELILEGTPVTKWGEAAKTRSFNLEMPAFTMRKAYPWFTQIPSGPSVTDSYPAPNALEAIESAAGTKVSDDDYRDKLSHIKVADGFKVTYSETPATPDNSTCSNTGPVIRPFTLTEGVEVKTSTGGSKVIEGLPVSSVLGFFEKYFQEGSGEILGSDSASAFNIDVYEVIQAGDKGNDKKNSGDDTDGDDWSKEPEIILEPGPPEPLPEATSGNSPGSPGELGTEVTPPKPPGSGGGGGGSQSGS